MTTVLAGNQMPSSNSAGSSGLTMSSPAPFDANSAPRAPHVTFAGLSNTDSNAPWLGNLQGASTNSYGYGSNSNSLSATPAGASGNRPGPSLSASSDGINAPYGYRPGMGINPADSSDSHQQGEGTQAAANHGSSQPRESQESCGGKQQSPTSSGKDNLQPLENGQVYNAALLDDTLTFCNKNRIRKSSVREVFLAQDVEVRQRVVDEGDLAFARNPHGVLIARIARAGGDVSGAFRFMEQLRFGDGRGASSRGAAAADQVRRDSRGSIAQKEDLDLDQSKLGTAAGGSTRRGCRGGKKKKSSPQQRIENQNENHRNEVAAASTRARSLSATPAGASGNRPGPSLSASSDGISSADSSGNHQIGEGTQAAANPRSSQPRELQDAMHLMQPSLRASCTTLRSRTK